MSDNGKEIALFRFQVIAPLLSLDKTRGALRREIRRLSERFHEHPTRGPTRYAFPTIEEWLYAYKGEGLEGLLPRRRTDRGKSRGIDDEVGELIENLALGHPDLKGPGILAELESQIEDKDRIPSLSSLYRFLKARGLDQRRPPQTRDHRAYAFDLSGDCWQGDVLYGPSIPTRDGKRRKTYLIAILDDATRLIAHAQFYFEQHLRCLKDCLKQAFLKRGLPRRLYFDNAQVFRSRMILQVCARLGIHLIHSRPFRPQGRAKLERWFGSLRRIFLSRVDLNRVDGLDHLNRLLFAWIEGEYHVTPHRGIHGETPLDRWVRLSEGIRSLPRNVDLEELFLEETTRRIAKDGTLTLKGKTFEAGPNFIGERVSVRFDPFDLRRVVLTGANDEKIEAFPVDLYGNRFVRRNPPKEPRRPTAPTELKSMEDLSAEIERKKKPDTEKNKETEDE